MNASGKTAPEPGTERGGDFMAAKMSEAWISQGAKAIVLIRILVGWAILSEGIQEFLGSVRSLSRISWNGVLSARFMVRA